MQDYLIIVGGGIQGLTIAYYALKQKKAKNVIIIEKQKYLGGLASYIKINNFWVDKFYHHYFKSDKYFLDLVHELGLDKYLVKKRFSSSFGTLGKTLKEKVVLASLLLIPNYNIVKDMSMKRFLHFFRFSSKDDSELVNLLKRKFGNYYNDVSAAWLWARIHARFSILSAIKALLDKHETLYFLYPSSYVLFDKLQKNIISMGGNIKLNTEVTSLQDILEVINIDNIKNNKISVVFTTPLPVTKRIIKDYLNNFAQNNIKINSQDFLNLKRNIDLIPDVKYTGVVNILVSIPKTIPGSFLAKKSQCKIIDSGIYWEHLPEKYQPFVVKVAQHVVFKDMPFKLFYIGAYVPDIENIDKYINLGKKYAMNILGLGKLNSKCSFKITIAKDLFASHIPTVDYVAKIPRQFLGRFYFNSNAVKVYSSSFAQLFPWDRGVNYAIKQGLDIVNML